MAQALHGGLQGALSGETSGSVLAADADLFNSCAKTLASIQSPSALGGARLPGREDGHEDDPN